MKIGCKENGCLTFPLTYLIIEDNGFLVLSAFKNQNEKKNCNKTSKPINQPAMPTLLIYFYFCFSP